MVQYAVTIELHRSLSYQSHVASSMQYTTAQALHSDEPPLRRGGHESYRMVGTAPVSTHSHLKLGKRPNTTFFLVSPSEATPSHLPRQTQPQDPQNSLSTDFFSVASHQSRTSPPIPASLRIWKGFSDHNTLTQDRLAPFHHLPDTLGRIERFPLRLRR